MLNLFHKRKNRIQQLNTYRKNKNFPIKEIPDNLFRNCPSCNENLSVNELAKNLFVCKNCGYHYRISSIERIRQIVDKNTFIEFDKDLETTNLDFYQYREKIETAKENTKLNEAVITGSAKICGEKVVICVMDSRFMMGSMGFVVGEKITRAIEKATMRNRPLIIVTTSGGARMQEGIISLFQMAKTSSALKKHSDSGLLYITVLTDPTTGGVSASFAMLGDIIIAEPKAIVGFAGKRVIEKTINEQLPEEFQKSEFLLERGFVDMIVERSKLKGVIYKLLKLHSVK